MPYEIRRRGSRYEVLRSDTGEVHAKHTTKAKAEAQVRVLESSEGVTPAHGGTITKRTRSGMAVRIHVKPKRRRSSG